MIYISHRGNIFGPKPELENSPEYIDAAISQGFDVEIDIWVDENGIHLGHDCPQYDCTIEWLNERAERLWIHCKNSDALNLCVDSGLHCFFHHADDYTMTSRGYVWAFPGQPKSSNKCIMVMPERVSNVLSGERFRHYYVLSNTNFSSW